jgi:hypothetical protein
MTTTNNGKTTSSYDPTDSGALNEIAKQHQADPETRDLTPEEKERAERILGEFEDSKDEQRNSSSQ